MELPLQLYQSQSNSVIDLRFNPCFNGTTSATDGRCKSMGRKLEVSILVLMELPLQRFRKI